MIHFVKTSANQGAKAKVVCTVLSEGLLNVIGHPTTTDRDAVTCPTCVRWLERPDAEDCACDEITTDAEEP